MNFELQLLCNTYCTVEHVYIQEVSTYGRLKGLSQPVCIVAICYCFHWGSVISITVQMT